MLEFPHGFQTDQQYSLNALAIDRPEHEPAGVLVRRLGEGAVVFDPRDWQTHILTPEAYALAEWLMEFQSGGQAGFRAAFIAEFGLDPDTPEIQESLRMLAEIGIFRP